MCKSTIIDTGTANLSSIKIALEKICKIKNNFTLNISADFDVIEHSDKLIVPGVGTAQFAMQNLNSRNLAEIIYTTTKPLLGICLGMQIMAKTSSETSQEAKTAVKCLGIIDSNVELLMNKSKDFSSFRLPHMGWNQVNIIKDHPIFNNIPNNSYFYFVHSYAMKINKDTIATCDYGESFTAVVAHNNFIGTQFHPEKSGEIGSKLLLNFINM